MAKKKLGMSTIEINKKFASREEAYKYAKRLKEFIRYTCKKNASKGWYGQAMIITSNTKGKVVSSIYYGRTGKVGRPKREKTIDTNSWYYGGSANTMWHIHVLLVSKPTYSFRELIKEYIDRNWIEVPNIYEKKKDFDYGKLKNRKVYKKNCNIGLAEYLFLQSEDIMFCDYNFTDSEIMPYSLKDLFKTFMYVGTFKKHNRRVYYRDEEMQEQVNSNLNKIMDYFWSITREQDKKDAERFMKLVQRQKIAENYEKEYYLEELDNNLQEDIQLVKWRHQVKSSIWNNISDGL